MLNIHITENHGGKMEGMASVSSNRRCNGRCLENAKIPGSICAVCYAEKLMKLRKNLANCLTRNYNILTRDIYPVTEMPIINRAFFRIESFGDVGNWIHAANYIRLIQRNPYTNFGWWTKNPDFLEEAFDRLGEGKPKNVQILLSSLFIDEPVKNHFWFVDKTFTVHSKESVKEGKVIINCQKTPDRKCINCLKCYLPNDIKEIHEEVK